MPVRFVSGAISLMILTIAVSLAGCYDDPYYPRAPFYDYNVTVTGLENFTTGNGSAMLYLPLPAIDGEPLLAKDWWPNYRLQPDEERHGTSWMLPGDTARGTMLAVAINMTDYYYSYARATPIAISPGQNMSGVPTIVPERINKSRSFDDIRIVGSGYVEPLDLPTSAEARGKVLAFLDQPLLPPMNGTGENYTTYVYLDEGLQPRNDMSRINITITLRINLNHNKVNVSEEGARRFEIHTYTADASIPGGVTGFIPVRVWRSSYSSVYF